MPTSALRIPAEGAASPRVGRPPRVQAPDIIAAAIEIGLDKVTLKQVADRLGVGIATLYRHVRNRDELVRLAAFRVALTSRLPRRDAEPAGHWTTVAIGYAETLFESFAREPQLVYELMKGRLGPDVEIDFLEQFLAALEPHGFTPAQGVQLHHAVAMLAIGAAVGGTAAFEAMIRGLGGKEGAGGSAAVRGVGGGSAGGEQQHVKNPLSAAV